MEYLLYILKLPRSIKQIIVFFTDVILSIISTWLALSIRSGNLYFFNNYDSDLFLLRDIQLFFLGIIVFIPIFIFFDLYKSIFRFSGLVNINSISYALITYGIIYFILFLIDLNFKPSYLFFTDCT